MKPPKKGVIFKSTYKYEKSYHIYRRTGSARNDGQGTIKLELLERYLGDGCKVEFFASGENTMIVDKLWFNENWTGRFIKILEDYEIVERSQL